MSSESTGLIRIVFTPVYSKRMGNIIIEYVPVAQWRKRVRTGPIIVNLLCEDLGQHFRLLIGTISRGDVPINPIILTKCHCFPKRGCCVASEDRCPAGFWRAFIRFALINTQVAVCFHYSENTLCFHYTIFECHSTNICRVSDCRKSYCLLYIFFKKD